MRNITILILITLFSCGTRKTSKTEENLEVSKKDTTEIVINSGKVEDKSETEATKIEENATWNYTEGTLSPIDPEKPMTHTGPDGKTNSFTNANISFGSGSGNTTTRSETSKEVKTQTKDTSATNINSGSSEELKKVTAKKESDRKGVGSNIGFWIGIAVATCIVLWLLWFVIIKRKKEKNELL